MEYYAEIQDLPQRLPDGLAGSLDQLVVYPALKAPVIASSAAP